MSKSVYGDNLAIVSEQCGVPKKCTSPHGPNEAVFEVGPREAFAVHDCGICTNA
jgi:hypothetical protein